MIDEFSFTAGLAIGLIVGVTVAMAITMWVAFKG
jgi:hypothetical protein